MLTDKIIKAVHEDIPNINSQLEQIAFSSTLFGMDGNETKDVTNEFQNAIDTISQNGGGKLLLVKGTHLISSEINVKPNVSIIGQGIDLSIIKVKENSNCNCLNIGWNDNVRIKDITIDFPTYLIGSINIPTNSAGNGIVIGTTNVADYKSLSTNEIEKLKINGCPENGIIINSRVWVIHFNSLELRNCGKAGIYNLSTDNSFSNIFTFNCLYGILSENGSNNKYQNCKLIMSGLGYSKLNSNTYDLSAGFRGINMQRSNLVNVECQDNSGHGFIFLNCSDNQFIGCLADGNGRYSVDNSIEKKGIGFVFWGYCKNNLCNITTSNYTSEKPQYLGLHISANSENFNVIHFSSDQIVENEILGTNININNSLNWSPITTNNGNVSGSILLSDNGILKGDLTINITTNIQSGIVSKITSSVYGLPTNKRINIPTIFEKNSVIIGYGITVIVSSGIYIISNTNIDIGSIAYCNI